MMMGFFSALEVLHNRTNRHLLYIYLLY